MAISSDDPLRQDEPDRSACPADAVASSEPEAVVAPAVRVPALDVIRGVALLGILLLNIVDFAWPSPAYESVAALYYTTDSVGEIPDPDADSGKRNGATTDEPKKEQAKKDDWMFLADRKPDLEGAFPLGKVRIAAVSSVWDIGEWAVVRVFFANKMRTLFCILFGAGLVYLTDGLIEKGIRPVWLHYRRMLLLLVIGFLHGALVWQGDILYDYAAVGLYLYPFRRLEAKTLARVAVGMFLSIIVLLWLGLGVFLVVKQRGPVLEEAALAAAARSLAAAGEADVGTGEASRDDGEPGDAAEPASPEARRNAARKAAVEALGFVDRLILRGHRALKRRDAAQRPELLTRDIRLHRDGTWVDLVKARTKDGLWAWLGALTPLSLLFLGWLMILGMSLAKSGFFAGDWPEARYSFLAFRLVPIGWVLEALILLLQRSVRRESVVNLGVLLPLGQAVVLMLALGYAAAIILVVRSGRFRGATVRLAMVGRMALSNYLAQSLLCTTIFHAHGLRLYGSVPRVGLVAVVFAVWALELWWSPLWLARHPSGPVEWCWRSLASMKRQPWRRPSS
jgi:uncharacterized protein